LNLFKTESELYDLKLNLFIWNWSPIKFHPHWKLSSHSVLKFNFKLLRQTCG